MNSFNRVVNTFNRVVNSFHRFLNNLMVECDMKVAHYHQGQQEHALNIVDIAITFQSMAMLSRCSAEERAEKFETERN